MGQYFTLVNTDKDETVSLPGTMKPIERVTNPKAMALIGYLLLQGPQDGTAFSRMNARPVDKVTRSDIQQWVEEEELPERYLEDYREADGEQETRRAAASAARVREAGFDISERNEYAGRWAGDSIALVGDYDDSGLYGDDSLTDITDPLISEFKQFVGEDWWGGEQESVMRPDMVFEA